MVVRRIGISTLASGSLLAAVATLMLVLPAFAAHVEPVFMDGNPKCTGEDGPNQPSLGMDSGVKVESDDLTEHVDDGTFSVDLVFDVEAGTLSFSNASPAVSAVIMKGGSNANVYFYNPAVTEDDGLTTPINPNNDKAYGISHVDFCFTEPEPEPSPTPTPSETTTPSPTPSETVTSSPSPTPEGTVSATETATEGAEVLDVVLEQPEVQGQQLPNTGASATMLLLAGLMMAAGGLLLVVGPEPARGLRRR